MLVYGDLCRNDARLAARAATILRRAAHDGLHAPDAPIGAVMTARRSHDSHQAVVLTLQRAQVVETTAAEAVAGSLTWNRA